MATWMTHLRVAESVIQTLNIPKRMFLVGNIAPDCGVPNEDLTAYVPPKKIMKEKNIR